MGEVLQQQLFAKLLLIAMIDLWYINVEHVNQELFEELLKTLPNNIKSNITSYLFLKDKKLKLFARLLVADYFQKRFGAFEWGFWEIANSGKPFITNGAYFNISHSENYVVVAFSGKEVGCDIEKVGKINVYSLAHLLHPEEQKYISMSTDKHISFYTVWTRKEAFLKAIGKGIINGLSNENCIEEMVSLNERWFIYSLFIEGYKLAVCTPIENASIEIRELSVMEILKSKIHYC